MSELTSVHDALSRAIEAKHTKLPYCTLTFKVESDCADTAKAICEKHGINMSEFLRECVKGLVKDYTG